MHSEREGQRDASTAAAAASAQVQELCYDGMSLTIRNYCLGFVGTAVAAFLANFSQACGNQDTPQPASSCLLCFQGSQCPTPPSNVICRYGTSLL